MVWHLEFTASASKALEWIKKREPQLYPRVVEALDGLSRNPYQGKALKGEFFGRYSYRIGTYRVIYRLHKGELILLVLNIGHRKDIYR